MMDHSMSRLDYQAIWNGALPFHDFVQAAAADKRPLWEGMYRIARQPEELKAPLGLAEPRRLLVIAADWCGDASNTIPAVARWVEGQPGLELRIVDRDRTPALMDAYLTNGSRSIPIVIALDAAFQPLGHWGPRPAELQAWVMAHKDTMEKEERYRHIRTWYARDRGFTTIRDIAALVMGAKVGA